MSRENKYRIWVPDIKRIYQVMRLDVEPQNGRQKYVTVWEHPCVESAIIKGKVAKFRLGQGVELMQYTGIKDKRGVEICEGDIVKQYGYWSMPNPAFVNNVVVFIDGGFTNCIDHSEHGAEIVGNIYENPDLMTF